MVDVYTDGSCSGNPGPGGWGAVVLKDGKPQRISGHDPHTTNNRMELTAAIKALEAVSNGTPVTVHSDSEYLVKTMTKGWKRNANQDLWDKLDSLTAGRKVDWQWVRGHNGDRWNEEADNLAVAAMQGNGTPPKAPPKEDRTTQGLTHVDAQGTAKMVDVGDKPDTVRTAIAGGKVTMKPETLALILQGRMEKGDVFTVARLAGINAAKHTWELIPLTHQLPLSHVGIDFETDPAKGVVTITASARTAAKTGVEMEALTAAAVCGLTIYDMCKAVDRGMVIGEVKVLEKHGGRSGDYVVER